MTMLNLSGRSKSRISIGRHVASGNRNLHIASISSTRSIQTRQLHHRPGPHPIEITRIKSVAGTLVRQEEGSSRVGNLPLKRPTAPNQPKIAVSVQKAALETTERFGYNSTMSVAAKIPPPGFDELSSEEKLDYVHALWDRVLLQPEDVPIPTWHREILAQRLAEYRSGQGGPNRSWDEVRAELHELLRQARR